MTAADSLTSDHRGIGRPHLAWETSRSTLLGLSMLLACGAATAAEAPASRLETLATAYGQVIQPLLVRYCHECHAGDTTEADVDLAAFRSLADVRRRPAAWQKIGEMLDSGQMPPPDAPQPSDADRRRLQQWVREYLTIEAAARAGDPGPVVLRRLSNAEYTYTLRDLTGLESLDPAHEFPVDGAAGEGFTNVGQALVMSPALLTKYLEAAKEVAAHAVPLPDGLRFSPSPSRRDWTNEGLGRIREFYRRYAGTGGGSAVNLQGIQFSTNQGGRLPLERYLEATLAERDALRQGTKTLSEVARARGLSPRYLDRIWRTLTADDAGPSLLVDQLRRDWRTATVADVPRLMADVDRWQSALWKFNTVGHLGREGAPRAWLEAVNPLVTQQEVRVKLPAAAAGKDLVLSVSVGDAGDGRDGDVVVWDRPRFVAPGRPEILLRDLQRVVHELTTRRAQLIAQTAACLEAAEEVLLATEPADVAALAQRHGVEPAALAAWLDYLGIGTTGTVNLGTPITGQLKSASGYDFIQGWTGDEALSVLANSSDQHVRIPGNMRPHSIAVHPTPSRSVAVGWRSPVSATLKISGSVQHAHPECGNGVTWSLDVRRGNTRQRLAAGISHGAAVIPVGPLDSLAVRTGDVVSLVIGPRDGNHSCDLTAIDLTLEDAERSWSLARDVSPQILAGNPHAGVWHFYSEPAAGTDSAVIPAGSLLARWHASLEPKSRRALAGELQQLLQQGPGSLAADAPDAVLHRQLTSFGGPIFAAALKAIATAPAAGVEPVSSEVGLPASLFGRHPEGHTVPPDSLCLSAPTELQIRLPAELVAGAEFVTTARLHAAGNGAGSVQLRVQTTPLEGTGLVSTTPILVKDGSSAQARIIAALDQYRDLFPPVLCYIQIVPVDEVVTLTLFHREDEHLRRLMLDDAEAAELDRLWDELLYIAREPLELVTAFQQLAEFATQDRPDLVKAFEPLRQPIQERADRFRQRLVDTEPAQLDAVLRLAELAFRRPLADTETQQLRAFYGQLRQQELSHDDALRLTLARVLVAPEFLYRAERPGPGTVAGPVTDWELASRLSYFLWSSLPDDELRSLAAAGRLSDPDVLTAQTRRMLRDPRSRRLATEFACRWLHIHGFDRHDEKSERQFPTFAGLRDDMYEEAVRVFTDFFQNNGSVLNLIAGDQTFLNEDLARHYGVPNVTGPEWRRVDGVRAHHRGGVLTLAATLATQSGASRTSPILRGNWVSEVLLGEKLPRPPKNVPPLDDVVPEGLTERQLIERHSRDAACAKCHARIDPLGFALEQFDAIGRYREQNAAGLPIDARTQLADGTALDGVAGLQNYLLHTRREAFLRQFHRKLLGYALGRSVLLSDEPLLEELQGVAEKHDYRIGTIVETMVLSPQFRQIRGRDQVDEE
jgi:hypothetical protein